MYSLHLHKHFDSWAPGFSVLHHYYKKTIKGIKRQKFPKQRCTNSCKNNPPQSYFMNHWKSVAVSVSAEPASCLYFLIFFYFTQFCGQRYGAPSQKQHKVRTSVCIAVLFLLQHKGKRQEARGKRRSGWSVNFSWMHIKSGIMTHSCRVVWRT